MPELPKRKPSDDEGRHTDRPYTQMALCGLSAGLTWRDMRHMKYTHLMQLLYEWEDMHSGESNDEPEPSNDAAGLLGL